MNANMLDLVRLRAMEALEDAIFHIEVTTDVPCRLSARVVNDNGVTMHDMGAYYLTSGDTLSIPRIVTIHIS